MLKFCGCVVVMQHVTWTNLIGWDATSWLLYVYIHYTECIASIFQLASTQGGFKNCEYIYLILNG